jgi:hypothetical protein
MPDTVLSFDPQTHEISVGGTSAEADCVGIAQQMVDYLESSAEEKTEPEIFDSIEGANAAKRKALRFAVDQGWIRRAGAGKRGDPFKYSYSRTDYVGSTAYEKHQMAGRPAWILLGSSYGKLSRE